MTAVVAVVRAAPHHPLVQRAAGVLGSCLPEVAFRRALGWLLALNVVDALFTLQWIQLALATEANPVMRWALERGPLHFLVAKCALVVGGAAVLWCHRERWLARVGLVPPALLYSLMGGVHVGYGLLYLAVF